MSTYKDLKSYQNAVIIHDFTVEFIKRYVDRSHTSDMSYKSYSRMADQMIQAARSGKQNIAEATSSSKQKPKSEPMLLGVASASLKELLEDYQDYLRQHGSASSPQDGSTSLTTSQLMQWDKNDPRALRVRGLYKSDGADRSYRSNKTYTSDTTHKTDTSYKSDRSYTTYKSYQTYLSNAEDACNAMICLINQTTYLLDNQIRAVERRQREMGVVFESRNARAYRALAAAAKRELEIDEIINETMKLKQ